MIKEPGFDGLYSEFKGYCAEIGVTEKSIVNSQKLNVSPHSREKKPVAEFAFTPDARVRLNQALCGENVHLNVEAKCEIIAVDDLPAIPEGY